jgi:hypothetical protein
MDNGGLASNTNSHTSCLARQLQINRSASYLADLSAAPLPRCGAFGCRHDSEAREAREVTLSKTEGSGHWLSEAHS